MLAVLIPTVALAVIGSRVVGTRHADLRKAEGVSGQVQVIDQLIHLRTALFAERVAWELLVPDRRPPDDVLATSEFGQLVLDESDPLARTTDEALARLAPEDRPFEPSELARIRAEHEEWSDSPDSIRERLEPLASRTESVMAEHAIDVRNTAVELGDSDLIAAGTTFQRSIRLPDDAAGIFAALSDLWGAESEDRMVLQSAVAAQLSRFETSSQNFAASILDSKGPVADFWNGPMQIPPPIQRLIDDVRSGVLTSSDRQPGEPGSVGLVLLAAVDWTVEADSLPLIAADQMIAEAEAVADDALSAERITAALVFLAFALSVMGAVMFGRSIIAPVRRLTGHAERLGGGELTLDPLPLDGPPDVASASAAINDVVGSLRLLEQKSRALADMDLEHEALREPLPGELGGVLQRSTEVLSTSIVERERLRSQLLHDATHDALTGVANRAALGAALERVGDPREGDGPATRAAVIFVHLGGFKQMRNRLGLAAGDLVLRATAARISAVAPAGSTVARFDGDEFAVLIEGTDADGAVDCAGVVVGAVGAPVELGGQVLRLRACAGVARLDQPESPLPGPADLLQRADLAVHQAREQGAGTVVVYDEILGGRVAEENDIESSLGAALQPEADELRVVFQPIVAVDGGALVGLETLVRWYRGGRCARPDEFVPVAERSDLIVQLDRWVLQAAVRQMAAWSSEPTLADVPVSVNVSGRTLLQQDLVADTVAALESHGVPPGRLTLEVTETALVTDLGLAAEQLERIRAAGVRVAIDDFGTGYTSIAQLRALPVDELKIDMSFVRRLQETTSDRVLVQMIQDLADLLDLFTVAEGVERAEQAEALSSIGCHALQGYFFSEPLEPASVVRWASERS